jgi:hypothetical protein
MTTPTDWRALCAELLEALENAIRVIYHEDGTKHISTADAVIAKADTALVQPEPQGSATLNWSEERQPCEECRYNHCIAETPFGRFLISWKGWKDYPAVTVDEAPFGEWFECWNSVEKAKSACQAEYNRRLAAAVGSLPSQPELQGPTDGELHQLWLDLYAFHDGPTSGNVVEIARAVLARWGHPATTGEQ